MKSLLIAVMLFLVLTPYGSQAQRPVKSKTARASVDGKPVPGNRATAKAGYEFVRKSDNEMAMRKKKKPKDPPKDPNIEYATYRCSCQSGGGSCTVGSNGTSIFCDNGSCTSCTLLITKSVATAPVITR